VCSFCSEKAKEIHLLLGGFIMIEIKNLETGMSYKEFVQGIQPNIPVWVLCTNPTREELQTIQTTFSIPWEDLEDSLDEDERPRLELNPDVPNSLKLVLRVPALEDLMKKDGTSIHPKPVTRPAVVFITGDSLITILSERFSSKRTKKPIGSRRKRKTPTILVLLDWLESVVKSFELAVDMIDRDLALVERVIFQSIKSSSIEKVFHLSRDATANIPELLDDLEDLSIDLHQQAELIRIYRDLIENSLDAYTSVISNNQNDLIKVLASISLILMVPTLIASLYGMNLTLPFATEPYAFLLILIASIILIIPIWVFLRRIDLL
jgi:magnesium transporter